MDHQVADKRQLTCLSMTGLYYRERVAISNTTNHHDMHTLVLAMAWLPQGLAATLCPASHYDSSDAR